MNPVFSSNVDIKRNAYLNWRTEKTNVAYNLQVLGADFADGAIALINAILLDNSDKKADALIMPILYSIDQSIELYIKAIIRELEELSGGLVSNYTSHDIEDLCRQMVAKIKKKEAKTAGLEKHLKPVTTYISELYSKIKSKNEKGRDVINIDFARYPINTDGDDHFYIEESDNVVIDIENLGKRFVEIRESLEALYSMYEQELQ